MAVVNSTALFMSFEEIQYNFSLLQQNVDKLDKETFLAFRHIFSSQAALLPSVENAYKLRSRILACCKPRPSLIPPAGMRRVIIPGDGHCLFRSLATALIHLGKLPGQDLATNTQVQALRELACSLNRASLAKPLPPSSTDNSSRDPTTNEMFRPEIGDPERYFQGMLGTSYGGEFEIRALAREWNMQIDVFVYDAENRYIYTRTFNQREELPCIRLCFVNNNHYDLFLPDTIEETV